MIVASASWIGSVPTWALLALAIGVAWHVSRGGGGAAVQELDQANKVLTESLATTREKLGGEIRDLRIENGELRGRTDVALALAPVLEWTQAHERRAQDRHDAMLIVLDLIAKRLGPDTNGSTTAPH